MPTTLPSKAMNDRKKGISRLILRTVMVDRQMERIRLEASYWDALDEIFQREDLTLEELCADLNERLLDAADERATPSADADEQPLSLANAIRVFVVGYYRKSATEIGHYRAGHGRGDPFQSTPFEIIPIH